MSGLGFEAIDGRPSVKQESLLLFKLGRQRWLIGVLAVPLFLCLAVGIQLLPPSYKASAQVTVESRTPRPPVRGSEVEVPVPFTEDVIGTEMAVLSSHELMSQIVMQLHLDDDPNYNPFLKQGVLARWKQQAIKFIRDQLTLDLHIALDGPDRQWS